MFHDATVSPLILTIVAPNGTSVSGSASGGNPALSTAASRVTLSLMTSSITNSRRRSVVTESACCVEMTTVSTATGLSPS